MHPQVKRDMRNHGIRVLVFMTVIVIGMKIYHHATTPRPSAQPTTSEPFHRAWYRSTVYVYEGTIKNHQQIWEVKIEKEECDGASRIGVTCHPKDQPIYIYLFGMLDGWSLKWDEIKLNGFPDEHYGGNSYYPATLSWEICDLDKERSVVSLPDVWVIWAQKILWSGYSDVYKETNRTRSYSQKPSW